MRILFTGASSFTGMWFAQTLSASGHDVTATLTRPAARYDGLRGARVGRVKTCAELAPETSFGSAEFLNLLERDEPYDVLCHHGANVTNYGSPDFDYRTALHENTRNIEEVIKVFGARGGRLLVYTGTIFEPDEGAGDARREAFSPYGLSKGLTSQVVRFACLAAGVRFGKFTIPNPVGPFEEPRFTTYLMREWKAGNVPLVRTPDYIRDNIAIDLLSGCYVAFIEAAAGGRHPSSTRMSPSGWVESQGRFSQRFAKEIGRRLALSTPLELADQSEFTQPLRRFNMDDARGICLSWTEDAFWDRYASYLGGLRD